MIMERYVEINDLYNFESISAPVYSPDGSKVLIVQNKMSIEKDAYVSSINLVDLKTGEEKVLIKPDCLNTCPTWSSEGEKFYFLSNREGIKYIYEYNFKNSEISLTVKSEYDIIEFLVHPSSRHILFVSNEKETNSMENKEYYEINKIFYKSNGLGILDGKKESLFIRDLSQKKNIKLDECALGYGLRRRFNISPSGETIIVEKRNDATDDFNEDTKLVEIKLGKNISEVLSRKDLTGIISKTGIFGEPCFSDDGRYLAFLGSTLPYRTSNEITVFVYDYKKETVKNFLSENDVQATDFMVGDFLQNNTNCLIKWSEKRQTFIVTVSEEGSVKLYEIKPQGGKAKVLENYREHISDFDINSKKNEIIFVSSGPNMPSNLYIHDFGTNRKQLKLFVNKLHREYRFAKYYSFEFENSDGGRIPAFLVTPPKYNSISDIKAKIPLVLNIHGGPYAMHGYNFHHEVQCMASKNMAILLVNPRGSMGYGQKHLDGVVGKYGEGDFSDLMTAIGKIIAIFGFIDEKQLYITGGSYGGFMTNWILTKTRIFRRAVTQRSMSNFVSMFGTSDIGYNFFSSENGTDILNPGKFWEKSPLAYVENVKTPTLVIHSEKDLRCPIEQAEQWYVALKYLGVETEFVRIKNENHELSRSGTPSKRVIRLKKIMEWFTK